jgi:hypothetical protein
MRASVFVLFFLIYFPSEGQLIFNRTFFGPPGSNQIAWSSTVDSAGNIYVVGHYRYNTPFAWLTLMKLDSAGNLLWSKADSFAHSGRKVKTLSDGNLMILGLVRNSWPPVRYATSLYKTDTAGNVLWGRVYYDTIGFYATDFIELPDKGFVLTGGLSDILNQQEDKIFLMRTDSVGAVLWCKLYGNGYPGYYPRSVVSTHDGGLMVGGNMVDIEDIVVFRTDSVGNLVWSKQFGGAKGDFLQSLIALSNGNYAFGGSSNSFLGAGSWPPFNQLLFQFDSIGNKIFCNVYFQGGSLSEHCNALAETASGKIIITGEGTTKMIDANGNAILWNALYMNSSVFIYRDQGPVFISEFGNSSLVRILKTDSLFSSPCYSYNYNPPLQLAVQNDLLPFSLNESLHVPFDSVVNTSLFHFSLNDSLYCLTATGVFQHETDPAISIVPNPFTEYISLINADEVSIDMLYVYDLSGALVKTIKYTGGKVDLSFLSSGMYFIKLFSIKKSFIKILKVCKID